MSPKKRMMVGTAVPGDESRGRIIQNPAIPTVIILFFLANAVFAPGISTSGEECPEGSEADPYETNRERADGGRESGALLDDTVPSIYGDLARIQTGMNGSGITICIVDSGIDPDHPSLDDLDDDPATDDPKIIAFYDAVNDPEDTSGNAAPYDDYGHGTHVASIAAGTGDGEPAGKYVGVAPGAYLVVVKVLGSNGGGNEEDELAGLRWAIDNSERYSIDIISCSWGHPKEKTGQNNGTSPQALLCDQAVEKGRLGGLEI